MSDTDEYGNRCLICGGELADDDEVLPLFAWQLGDPTVVALIVGRDCISDFEGRIVGVREILVDDIMKMPEGGEVIG